MFCSTKRNQWIVGSVVGASTAALCLGVFGCGGRRTESTEKIGEQVRLRLPWTFQAQFAGPILAARPGGAYERNGLAVSIEQGGLNINAPQDLADGLFEFGILQPDQMILANARVDPGKRLQAVAVVFRDSMTCFMVKRGSGIQTVRDMKGKRVGTKEGTNVHSEFLALLARESMTLKDVVPVPVQWDLGLLVSGKVDVFPGFTINEPFQARAAGADVSLITPSQFGLRLYGDIVAARESTVKERKSTVQAFVKGTLEGWREACDDRKRAIAEILRRNPLLHADHQEFMLDACCSLRGEKNVREGVSEESVWIEMVQMLEGYGSLPKGVVSPRTLYTNSMLPATQ